MRKGRMFHIRFGQDNTSPGGGLRAKELKPTPFLEKMRVASPKGETGSKKREGAF